MQSALVVALLWRSQHSSAAAAVATFGSDQQPPSSRLQRTTGNSNNGEARPTEIELIEILICVRARVFDIDGANKISFETNSRSQIRRGRSQTRGSFEQHVHARTQGDSKPQFKNTLAMFQRTLRHIMVSAVISDDLFWFAAASMKRLECGQRLHKIKKGYERTHAQKRAHTRTHTSVICTNSSSRSTFDSRTL